MHSNGIPLQHINTEILQSMRRGTTHEKTVSLIDTFRAEVPEMAIRTTLIIGYPGETEEIFENENSVCLVYQFSKPGVKTRMIQTFEINDGKISKIKLVFDTKAFR